MQLVYVVAFALIYAMGYLQGWLGGQIQAGREHLKFLRESSARADELHLELVAQLRPENAPGFEPDGRGE